MKKQINVFMIFITLITMINLVVAQASQRRGSRRTADAGNGKKLNRSPIPKNDVEKKILKVINEMTKDRNRRYRSISENDGRFMRQLAEAAGAKKIVEIGMSTGYSGLWFSIALKSTGGKLITHEMDKTRIKMARNNFKEAGVDDIITIVEGNAHETIKKLKGPIDILFLDADKPGYIDYLKKLMPLIRPGGLILAHNMNYPKPDPDFIKAITTDPELTTSFVLMDGAGISMTVKKR